MKHVRDQDTSFTTVTTTQSSLSPPGSTLSGKNNINKPINTIRANDRNVNMSPIVSRENYRMNHFDGNNGTNSVSSSLNQFRHLDSSKSELDTSGMDIWVHNIEKYDRSDHVGQTLTETDRHASHSLIKDSQQPIRLSQPKYSDEPLLNKSSHFKSSVSISNSSNKSSTRLTYVQSIEVLRQSLRDSLSDSLPNRFNNIIAPSSSMGKVPLNESIRPQPSPNQRILLTSLCEGLAPFQYVSTSGEVLALTFRGDIVYCCDMSVDRQRGETKAMRLFVDHTKPLQPIVSELSRSDIIQFESLRRGRSLTVTITPLEDICCHPIKAFLSIISDESAFCQWTIFSNDRNQRNLGLDNSVTSKLYDRICELLPPLKSRLPKMIMYINIQPKNDICDQPSPIIADTSGSGSSVNCKCMLMSNTPLPHFCIQFKDKTSFRYDLKTGNVSIDYFIQHIGTSDGQTTDKRIRWNGNIMNAPSSSWCDVDGLPADIQRYMTIAQRALDKCLSSESNLSQSSAAKYKPVTVPIDFTTIVI
jgi:hypothetical protein